MVVTLITYQLIKELNSIYCQKAFEGAGKDWKEIRSIKYDGVLWVNTEFFRLRLIFNSL